MAAGNDVTALYLYSEPNSILMSEYATAQVGRPTETQIQKTNLEETLRSMVDAKTLNDERWTSYVVSGQQYWVRAVHYYGAWLISVVNLDRQCSQATDGMLAFAQPDGVLLAGTRPEEGELSHYISLTAETEGLVLEYYVPSTDMDLDNAMNLAPLLWALRQCWRRFALSSGTCAAMWCTRWMLWSTPCAAFRRATFRCVLTGTRSTWSCSR